MELSYTCVVTNKTPSGAYRGFGVPEGILTMERIIDRVARSTGTDRIELRRRMLIQEDQMAVHDSRRRFASTRARTPRASSARSSSSSPQWLGRDRKYGR